MQDRFSATGVVAPPPETVGDYKDYVKVLALLGVWLAAVITVVIPIDTGPTAVFTTHPGAAPAGYTISLVLLALPMAFLVWWYVRNRTTLQLRVIMRAQLVIIGATAGLWILLDIFLAKLLFVFPNTSSHVLGSIPGYSWTGACSSLWTVFDGSCYTWDVPVEEVIFYLGGTAVLSMMYMWGAEDFFAQYSLPRAEYAAKAKTVPPLVRWNGWLIALGIALVIGGVLVKKLASFHEHHAGLPIYFFFELGTVFVPLAALYTRVHAFTNTRAFLFVMLLQVLISVIWEATFALPYGWWNYQLDQMIGIVVTPWSEIAIEACGLWLSVASGVMFIYEATKIKALSQRSWRDVLFGR